MASYPPYSLTITGPDGSNRVMTGTHDGALVTSNPRLKIKFELTNGDADPPVQGQKPPNLLLTLTEVVEE